MSYVNPRPRDDWDRATEIVDGDLERARALHDALWTAYQTIARLGFDSTAWPVDGHDRASTLSVLAELMGPKDITVEQYQEWLARAHDLIRTGSLS